MHVSYSTIPYSPCPIAMGWQLVCLFAMLRYDGYFSYLVVVFFSFAFSFAFSYHHHSTLCFGIYLSVYSKDLFCKYKDMYIYGEEMEGRGDDDVCRTVHD